MINARKIHFVGIGGVGISALAQLYHHNGWEVTGTNDNPSPETLDRIRDMGVKIFVGADIKNIDPETALIVYSDAWLTMDPEFMEQLKQTGIPMLSYFEALGSVSEEKRTIAVSGTNGKTTTTGMLAKILRDAGASPTAIVGSIVADFGSNYLAGTSDLLVAEACEYRRHFLNITPEVLVITNLELDHTDYYSDLPDVQDAFRSMIQRVPSNGTIVTDMENPNIQPLLEGIDMAIVDYTVEPPYEIKMPGEFNQMNARAAAAAARVIMPHITDSEIRKSLADFQGTWRRFEYKGKTANGADLYDDYAHHPTSVEETIRALRARHPDKRVIIAFHPHLYSRTRDLLDGFSRSFTAADEVLIAPIYRAREVDDGTVSSEMLAERIREKGVSARAFESLDEIKNELMTASANDVIMTMGAGDIYKVANALVQK